MRDATKEKVVHLVRNAAAGKWAEMLSGMSMGTVTEVLCCAVHGEEGKRMSIEQIGKWIYARECPQPPERLTRRWAIVATDGAVELGEVKWFGKWRCYAYFPLFGTLYEKQCLRDIADFCERQTFAQRAIAKVRVTA